MGKVKEWPSHKWPGGTYKGKPVGKYGPLGNTNPWKQAKSKTNSEYA